MRNFKVISAPVDIKKERKGQLESYLKEANELKHEIVNLTEQKELLSKELQNIEVNINNKYSIKEDEIKRREEKMSWEKRDIQGGYANLELRKKETDAYIAKEYDALNSKKGILDKREAEIDKRDIDISEKITAFNEEKRDFDDYRKRELATIHSSAKLANAELNKIEKVKTDISLKEIEIDSRVEETKQLEAEADIQLEAARELSNRRLDEYNKIKAEREELELEKKEVYEQRDKNAEDTKYLKDWRDRLDEREKETSDTLRGANALMAKAREKIILADARMEEANKRDKK